MRDITAVFRNGVVHLHWFTEDAQGSLTLSEEQAEKLCNSLSFAIADLRCAKNVEDCSHVG